MIFGSTQTPLRKDAEMSGRKRKNLLIFYVNDEEFNLIEEKMRQAGIRNRSAYIRKMAIDGYVIHVDHSFLKNYNWQLHMIGININQIAHHMNATGSIYRNEVKQVREMQEKIWQLQRSIVSSLR